MSLFHYKCHFIISSRPRSIWNSNTRRAMQEGRGVCMAGSSVVPLGFSGCYTSPRWLGGMQRRPRARYDSVEPTGLNTDALKNGSCARSAEVENSAHFLRLYVRTACVLCCNALSRVCSRGYRCHVHPFDLVWTQPKNICVSVSNCLVAAVSVTLPSRRFDVCASVIF